MRTHILALIALVAVPLACRSSGTEQDGVPFENLQRGYASGLRDAGVRVARTQAEWNELWKQHNSTTLGTTPELFVDFDRKMVVCVMLGDRPTPGYSVEIRALRLVDGVLRVEAVETDPDEAAYLPQVVTQPYHMVTTARCDARVEL